MNAALHHSRRFAPTLVGLFCWFLVGLAIAYWTWRVWGMVQPAHMPPPVLSNIVISREWVVKALKTTTSSPPDAGVGVTASPLPVLRLTGVAHDTRGIGVAVISIDDKPGMPFRVGALVTKGWRLKAISAHEAVLMLDDGAGREVRLQLARPNR